jgi:putative transposase
MPWSEITPMDQRRRFISDVQQARDNMTTLCARYGISRKTGYKWLSRYAAEGPPGLLPRSHRTHTTPFSTSPEVATALLELRQHHPTWGAKKLLTVLARREPRLAQALPARSTAAALLKRHGLITSPRRRRAIGHPGRPTTPMEEPNAIWTADFKGQFKTRDGRYCFPLTVADGASRYLLACRGLTSVRTEEARPVFQALFHSFGLPTRIRSDNGVPFATIALGRLSPLSVWWIRLGILPELIEPAHPEQNGRHERMHRTLKAETTRPPASNRRAQQRVFDRFQEEYNTERPHEGLALRTPAECYSSSPRVYPARLPSLEYPAHCEIRLVSRNGGIRWHNHWVNVSHVLGGEYIALEEIDDGLWTVSFGPLVLGRFDERRLCIEDVRGTTSRNPRKVSPISQD